MPEPHVTPQARRRHILRWLAAVGALVLLLALLPLLALRSTGLRHAILERVATMVRSSTGVELTADDFQVDLGRRRIVVDRLAVSAAGAEGRPFLVIDRVAAVIETASLLRRAPIRIVTLDIEGARLDLAAPLPSSETADETRPLAAPLPIEIRRLTLAGGSVAGAPFDDGAAARLGSWDLNGLGATGSLLGGRMEVAIERGSFRLSGQPPARGLEAAVSGRISGAPAGPFTVDELRLVGDGLDATAHGTVGIAATDPQHVAFILDAEPGRLFPETGPSRVTATADLDLRALAGTLQAEATGIPGELFEPMLGADVMAWLNAATTFLDGRADLRLHSGDRLSGSAHMIWREGDARGRQPILVVDARSAGEEPQQPRAAPGSDRSSEASSAWSALAAAPIVLDLDATLLPSWSGRRTASARLRIPSSDRLAETEVLHSSAAIETPDLARALRDVDQRFPGLVPALPEGLRIEGPLELRARAEGPVADPRVELHADWRPQTGALILLTASGRPIGDAAARRRLTARAVVTDLDLGEIEALHDVVLGGSAGATVTIELLGDELRGSATADARGLILQDDLRLDAVHVELSGTPREIAIEHLEAGPWGQGEERAGAGAARLVASGRLDLDIESAQPLRGATLMATIEHPFESVAVLETRLVLHEGRLHVEVARASTDYGEASGTIDFPLGPLAAVPALADRIAELPTPAADGPVRVELMAPGFDAAALLRRLELDGPETLTGDVALTASLDPSRPAGGRGLFTVENLVAAGSDPYAARLEALDPLTLRLADSRITLEPLRIAVGGKPTAPEQLRDTEPAGRRKGEAALELRVAGEVDLATDWKPGDAIGDLAGPLRLEASAESVDGVALLAALGLEPPFESLRADGAELQLTLDPADPAAAEGLLALRALDLDLGEDHRLRMAEPLSIRLGDRRLRLAPTRLEIDGQAVTMIGEARFDPEWRPGQPPGELVASLEGSITGTLEAAALNPYLAGAAASGRLALDAAVSGTLDALTGHARLGPAAEGAEIALFDPYFTRLRDPRVELRIEGGVVTIETATAELNEGRLRLTGGASLADGTIDLAAILDDVRYRLDYGVLTESDGQLHLTRAAGGSMRLEGRIVLDRGVLRRDLDADREILRYLFAPETIEAPSALDDLELDLEIATVDGLRIHNNLADVRATWSPLTITGTLAEPRVEGAIEIDPGGYLFAYGQTVRVDSGHMELRGDGSPPELELETTTSIEDPSVARAARGRGFLDQLRDPLGAEEGEAQDLEAAIGAGIADYYGERIAGRLSEGLGALDVSLRPILVFGLDNPGTELTVSRGLSTYVTAAVSVSLREEGKQTYVAEVHDLESLERFLGQLYTLRERNDPTSEQSGSSQGIVIQQRLLFGGGGNSDQPGGPRLRRIVLDSPGEVVGRRTVRRRLGYEPGQPLAPGATFETEVEVAELLRRRGYPGARVTARLVPADKGRADLRIAVAPGSRVSFEFRGTELHASQQQRITSIYRPDFYEPVSLEEMRQQAVRELRSAGFIEPSVEITVEGAPATDTSAEIVRAAASATPIDALDGHAVTTGGEPKAEAAATNRTVIVTATGGERVMLAEPRFDGIDGDAAAAVAQRFPSPVLRAELLAGEAGADRRLRAALSEEGYPDAVVEGRSVERVEGEGSSARRPFLAIAPAGPRHRIVEVRVTGLEDEDPSALVSLAPVSKGDAVRSERITRGTLAIENALHEQGHARARVRARLLPATGPDYERTLAYEVARSGVYQVGEVTIAGTASTRERWAAEVAGLLPGAPLGPSAVRAARRRLFQTGLFDAVLPQIDYTHPGGAADIKFVIEEKPRFEVAYGALWQSGRGASAVVDAVDHNALGRGITLGARARYRDDDKSGRLYGRLPRVLGTRASIEAFAEYSQERFNDPGVNLGTDTFELDLHTALPLGPGLEGRVYARYRDIEIFELEPDPFFPLPTQTFAWPLAGVQLRWDRRDDPISTTRGTFASVDLSGADEALGSDFSYARIFTRASHHLPFGSFQGRPLLWAQSARLGLARAFRGQNLVGFELLFAGGEYSIRGYDEDSIGPGIFDDVDEQALAVFNQELHVPLWGDLLSGVVFFDGGQVLDDFRDLGSDFLTSGGVGLRALTPVGTLRLDVAYPFDRRPGDDRITVYFGLGNVF